METIKLDLIPGKKMPSLHASQYDDGREHGIDLFENGVAYKLDGTETLTINERKGDDCICSLDIENTFTGSNHIVFASTEQMCAVWGNNICELVIAKGEKTIGTLNFILEVEPSPTEGGIESESEIKNLKRQIEAITEEVIGDDYYTAEQTDEAIASAIEGKADTTYVNTELNKKADKTDTYTKTQVDNALSNKMDKANPTGTGRIAVGQGVVASGAASQAFGVSSTASGLFSHAEGFATTASGESSHAEGYLTTASGYYSHAEGNNTTANHKSQHVFGEYNIPDGSTAQSTARGNYIEIVGNGESSYARSNARTLDWQGNETLMGDLTYNGNKSLTSEISRLDGRIDDLPEPMIFKGTLGVGGTIQTLPTASAEIEGWTFKCITAGTYAGLTLKVGDTVTCFNPPNTSVYEWDISGYGDTDTDTWRAIKVEGVEKLGNGISSGAVDFVGSDNIEVDFDANGNKVGVKTKNIYTKTEVDDIVSNAIYNVLPDDTASGSVANFETDLALPLKSLEVDVDAKQDLHGYDHPWAGGAGKNIVDFASYFTEGETVTQNGITATFSNGYLKVTGTNTSSTFNIVYKNSSVTLPAGTYIMPYNLNVRASVDGGANVNYNSAITAELSVKIQNFYVFVAAGATVNYNIPMMLVKGTTRPTEYEPYENICPIEGWDAITLNVNGNTEVINLGGTYYGGHFTQDKDGHRQFEVTHGYYNLGSLSWTHNVNGFWQANKPDDMARCNASVVPQVIAEKYQMQTGTWVYGHGSTYGYFGMNGGLIYITDENTPSGYIVAPLATPIIIDLPDGEPIITLTGVNNFFADTGDTSVVFKSSVNDYVSAHSGGNLLGMGGVYLGGAKSGGCEEEPDEGEDTEKVKLDEPKEEIKTIGDTKKLGGD